MTADEINDVIKEECGDIDSFVEAAKRMAAIVCGI